MVKTFKVGDLVKFVQNPNAPPPYVIPRKCSIIGIVHDFKEVKVGDDDTGAIMRIVHVRWSNPRWNTKSGWSEESPHDLELVQSAK
tara:strand:- start:2061 stop:2318 length:258 start_codon:yes stop_codon:yes gene_type:complete